jgi:hypothetical protein
MFEPKVNKYARWYFELTGSRQELPRTKGDEYYEAHHIHPKCLGGKNTKVNLVLFTPREHFIAHLLLTKMLDGDAKRKMHFAFHSMRRGTKTMPRHTPNGHLYEIFVKNIPRGHTDETRAKMSVSQRNRAPITDEARQNLSNAIAASYTPELRALRSESQKDRVFSVEHRENMRQRAQERWARGIPESHREAARQRRGAKNGMSKTWSLQSPSGKLHLTSACNDFCIEHELSYYALRNKATTRDTTPVSRGASKGWSVLSCTDII